jgi:hypothetical protein
MSDEHQPGEVIQRLMAGIHMGQTLGAGHGAPTPRGAEVNAETGEVTRPEPKQPEPEVPAEEPEADPVKESVQASLERVKAYIDRVARQVT